MGMSAASPFVFPSLQAGWHANLVSWFGQYGLTLEPSNDFHVTVKTEDLDHYVEGDRSLFGDEARHLLHALTKMDVNARNYDRKTPLHVAARAGSVHFAKFLLDRGADVNAREGDIREWRLR